MATWSFNAALCGFALIDARVSQTNIAIRPGEQSPEFSVWRMGDIIEVSGDGGPTIFTLAGSVIRDDNPEGRCDDVEGLCVAERLNQQRYKEA